MIPEDFLTQSSVKLSVNTPENTGSTERNFQKVIEQDFLTNETGTKIHHKVIQNEIY